MVRSLYYRHLGINSTYIYIVEVCKPKKRHKTSRAETKFLKKPTKRDENGLISSNFLVFRQILQVRNPNFMEFCDEISWLAHHY